MNKKWQGFTLIESLLVLFLISLVSIFPRLQVERWRESQETQYFFTTIDRELFLAQASAVVSRKKTKVKGDIQENELLFDYFDERGREKRVMLHLPTTVRLTKGFSLTFSPGRGTISRITSFHFALTVQPYHIHYQYFIGSGRFEKRM